MPRLCSVCAHPERPSIDGQLVAGEPYRAIAQRFAASPDAVFRHKGEHLPIRLVKAQAAAEVAAADDLLTQLRDLQATALRLLDKAEQAGDIRTALAGPVPLEAESALRLELLAKLLGELAERPTLNLLVAPEWVQTRAALLEALRDYPEASQAVSARLLALEAPR